MKIKIRNPFSRNKRVDSESSKPAGERPDIENVIVQDTQSMLQLEKQKGGKQTKKRKIGFQIKPKQGRNEDGSQFKSRKAIVRLAYNLLAGRIPGFPEYRVVYEQAAMPMIYEAYLSTGILLSLISTVPTFIISSLLEIRLFPRGPFLIELFASAILATVAFAVTFLIWMCYPILRKGTFKSKLENQLAYSFGILGVLSSSGMSLERLFERVASSESNPVLGELARRFLRNVKMFGLDSDKALAEVANHSPSKTFASMLESMAVALRTTGTIRDLVMFESARLLKEKSDKLRKTISSLAVMAELYITLVVVGPIIFIVMMAIFGLLPSGGLPNPILMINLIVFIGIPVLSVMMVLLLDSLVGKA